MNTLRYVRIVLLGLLVTLGGVTANASDSTDKLIAGLHVAHHLTTDNHNNYQAYNNYRYSNRYNRSYRYRNSYRPKYNRSYRNGRYYRSGSRSYYGC